MLVLAFRVALAFSGSWLTYSRLWLPSRRPRAWVWTARFRRPLPGRTRHVRILSLSRAYLCTPSWLDRGRCGSCRCLRKHWSSRRAELRSGLATYISPSERQVLRCIEFGAFSGHEQALARDRCASWCRRGTARSWPSLLLSPLRLLRAGSLGGTCLQKTSRSSS